MKQVAIAFDQLLNALMGGWADETLSARVWRNRNRSWWWKMWLKIIDSIFYWQTNHCFQSHISEIERSQLPRYYRHYPTSSN